MIQGILTAIHQGHQKGAWGSAVTTKSMASTIHNRYQHRAQT